MLCKNMDGLLSSDRAKPGSYVGVLHAKNKAVPTVDGFPLVSRRLKSRAVEPEREVSLQKSLAE